MRSVRTMVVMYIYSRRTALKNPMRLCSLPWNRLVFGQTDFKMAMQSEDVLDLRGLKCPLPALMTRNALAQRPQGATLAVIADDPLAVLDIPHMCAGIGEGGDAGMGGGQGITLAGEIGAFGL